MRGGGAGVEKQRTKDRTMRLGTIVNKTKTILFPNLSPGLRLSQRTVTTYEYNKNQHTRELISARNT